MKEPVLDEFGKILLEVLLLKVCDQETSQDPEGWTPENPLWGHCAVVSLVVQGIFGGDLLRASLDGTPFAKMRSHYWNRLPDGREVDFTRAQFGESGPGELKAEVRTREYVLSYAPTVQRHELLLERLGELW
ncbi:MAG: hypothetical protein Q7S32_02595 [bacterium]|nr:hypothetical protein [bacterium]